MLRRFHTHIEVKETTPDSLVLDAELEQLTSDLEGITYTVDTPK